MKCVIELNKSQNYFLLKITMHNKFTVLRSNFILINYYINLLQTRYAKFFSIVTNVIGNKILYYEIKYAPLCAFGAITEIL